MNRARPKHANGEGWPLRVTHISQTAGSSSGACPRAHSLRRLQRTFIDKGLVDSSAVPSAASPYLGESHSPVYEGSARFLSVLRGDWTSYALGTRSMDAPPLDFPYDCGEAATDRRLLPVVLQIDGK